MAERRVIWLMRLWALLFIGTGVAFLALPDFLVQNLSRAGVALGLTELPCASAPSAEEFWVVLAAAMMFTIGYLALLSASAPQRNLHCAYAIVVAKLASSAGGVVMYFLGAKALPFLIIFAVDFPIAVITAGFLLALRPSTGASFRNAASH